MRDVIGRAGRGDGGVLVVRGEAGVGKTSLLRNAVVAADAARVSHIAAIESESDLQYAGLHLLLSPFMDGLPALPEPQRRALGTAFGLESGPAPQRFLVGLATLGLLAEAAGGRTVVCVVDDAQWLDRESADTLAFAARRVGSGRIALLFGTGTRTTAARSSPVCPNCAWRGSRRTWRGTCSTGRASTTGSPGGWSPAPVAIRWPCWNCARS